VLLPPHPHLNEVGSFFTTVTGSPCISRNTRECVIQNIKCTPCVALSISLCCSCSLPLDRILVKAVNGYVKCSFRATAFAVENSDEK
jgi:hypothetical protein